MASFSDLEFGRHPEVDGGIIARKEFDNGYGIVVERYYITDERGAILNYTLGSENGLYQIGFTKGGEPFFEDPMPNNYIGAASEEVVTEIISMVESAKITVSIIDEDEDVDIDTEDEENLNILDYRHNNSFMRGNYSIDSVE
jgi:hypothetical protein